MTPDEIQKDREMPSTSWAVWAWQAYRDGALVDPATLTAENAALKERVKELEATLRFYADPDLDGYEIHVTNYGLSTEDGHIIKDAGDKARATLKELGYE